MKRGIALLVGGTLAAPAALPVQLAFAISGIGVVGMLHGAGDLAVVPEGRRPLFLAAYGLISLSTLLWWINDPAIALPAFLLGSAMHFGIRDARDGTAAERLARGVALILAPAALHCANYASFLRLAGNSASTLAALTPMFAIIGGLAGAALLLLVWYRRDLHLALGVGVLLLLPHSLASRSAF